MQHTIPPEFIEEFKTVADILSSDAVVLMKNVEKEDIDFWRRTVVRTLSADIEAMCFQIRERLRLEVNDPFISRYFSSEEIAIIKEIDFRTSNLSKNLKERAGTFEKRFLFTMEMHWKSGGKSYPVLKNSTEWKKFKKFISIRNRVVHPQSSADLHISDEEKDLLLEIGDWYRDQLMTSTEIRPDLG